VAGLIINWCVRAHGEKAGPARDARDTRGPRFPVLPGYLPEAMFDRDFGAIWKSAALPQTQSLTLGLPTGTK
jgi:hypothetical protein